MIFLPGYIASGLEHHRHRRLQPVKKAVVRIPGHVGSVLAVGLTVFYLADFIVCVRARLGGAEDEEPVIGRLKVF